MVHHTSDAALAISQTVATIPALSVTSADALVAKLSALEMRLMVLITLRFSCSDLSLPIIFNGLSRYFIVSYMLLPRRVCYFKTLTEKLVM